MIIKKYTRHVPYNNTEFALKLAFTDGSWLIKALAECSCLIVFSMPDGQLVGLSFKHFEAFEALFCTWFEMIKVFICKRNK